MFFIFYPSKIALTMLFLIIITIQGVEISIAHSGGTDSFGCHAGSKPYHCHGGPDNSNNFINSNSIEEPTIYRSTKNNSNADFLYFYFALSSLVGFINYLNRKNEIGKNNDFDKNKMGAVGYGVTCFIASYILLIIFASPKGFF
jgi:hypothetical protein